MGMTIDETKQELMKILALLAVSEKQYNAVKNALIIITKYQKIEEIYKNYKDKFEFVGMQQIGEILKEENKDD